MRRLAFGNRASLLAAMTVLAHALPARAYQRTLGPDEKMPARWDVPRIDLRLTEPLPGGLSRDDVGRAIANAAAAWSYPAAACSGVSITLAGATPEQRVLRDGVNAVIFRSRVWCRDGIRERGNCYSERMLAATTPHFEPGTSTIREADIELNAVGYRFGVTEGAFSAGSESDKKPVIDLQSVLTHELGHLLGFAHPCRSSFAASNVEIAAPLCRSLARSKDVSVMVPLALGREPTLRRELSADDVKGLCALYARASTRTTDAGPMSAPSSARMFGLSARTAATPACSFALSTQSHGPWTVFGTGLLGMIAALACRRSRSRAVDWHVPARCVEARNEVT